MQCNICTQQTAPLFTKLVLNKHNVQYYKCPSCDFIQTEQPYWLNEAYSSAISDLDLGPVNRAIRGSRLVEGVILAGFNPNAAFIDWGGGYGVFTRMMRDIGYDFYWSDLYCENLFARQFAAQPGQTYELLTAFEVFEHLVNPIDEIATMLTRSRSLLFTTLVPPADPHKLASWWYLTLEHGQHISLYSLKSLQILAERFGLHLTSDGASTHLLTTSPMSEKLFKMIVHDGKAAWLWRRFKVRGLRPKSRLMSDFQAVTGWDI
jgi:2-polyprenyl-3-methyl-5-hydroxy-6-metoxy-1,4-benzoquinol methylase